MSWEEALAEHVEKNEREFTGITETFGEMKTFIGELYAKSDAKLEAINAEVRSLRSDVTGLKGDMATVKADVAGLKGDMATVKADVAELRGDMATVKADVAGLKGDMATVKADVAGLKGDMATLLSFRSEATQRFGSIDRQLVLIVELLRSRAATP